MISIKPNKVSPPRCLSCEDASVTITKFIFQGLHVLQDCVCEHCGLEFYHTLPISHDFYFPVSFSKDKKLKSFDPKVKDWHADPLIQSLDKQLIDDVFIEVKSFVNKKEIILLNCLDSIFAHFLSRIFNAPSLIERYPNMGLVILVPSKFEYLVPNGVAEIWAVNLSIKECNNYYKQVETFVWNQFERFDKVLLSKALYLNPYKFVDIEKICKTKSFDIHNFHKIPPVITFSLREDRFWHNSHIMGFLLLIGIKYRLMKWLKPIYIWRQNQLINRTVDKLNKEFESVSFFATGMGNRGGLQKKVTDLRTANTTSRDELRWLEVYSKSHVVIGVHGANMILATSLSGGFIDIVPRYKISNWNEDTIPPFHQGLSNFLGRCLDEYSSENLIVTHVKNIIQGFEYQYLNAHQNPE
ncbi:MAG: hypothetical protein ACXIUD_11715 [Mongoliitalea sp.]